MVRLSVNLNKVALLRNARDIGLPSVTRAATTCIDAGAQGITVHPRPDERHVRAADVIELAALTSARGIELNVEGYPSDAFLALVRRVRPAQCTLVPDAPDQRTSDHGWDVATNRELLRKSIDLLTEARIRVSLFMTPGAPGLPFLAELGADCIELYTGPYARAFHTPDRDALLDDCAQSALKAGGLGLLVNAGHDLNLQNLPLLCMRIPGLAEVSIGHALIADALDLGLAGAVRAYLGVLRQGANAPQGNALPGERGSPAMQKASGNANAR